MRTLARNPYQIACQGSKYLFATHLSFACQHQVPFHGPALLAYQVAEYVFLARKIVEECSLAHIRALGNIFDLGVRKAFAGEQLHRRNEELLARLLTPPLPPSNRRRHLVVRTGCDSIRDHEAYMTTGHIICQGSSSAAFG